MEYAYEERIGNPELFTGRKKELQYLLSWCEEIKRKGSKSTALLARRKIGKTAILERLFNILYENNNGVIPFYYEIKETEMWVGEFCVDFFLTFIYQYIAFKSRKVQYLKPISKSNLKKAKQDAAKEGLDFLVDLIDNVEYDFVHKNINLLWEKVRNAPHSIADIRKEFIVQMIDEFQFMNANLFIDKAQKNRAKKISGAYLGTAESKIAPLLISGSWVGWLMDELNNLLPVRFLFEFLENMPQSESLEMIYNYSQFFGVPVSEEVAYLLAEQSEGSPFYISAIIRSKCPGKNLLTADGLTRVMTFETLDKRGEIKSTWMEYIASAFTRVNDTNAKNIVLYLCKHRQREVTRKELMDTLKLNMTDAALEKRLKALVKADIISQGVSNNCYQGVNDKIFDKVFRGVYQKEIEAFDPADVSREFTEISMALQKQYRQLLGKFNYHKGLWAEYLILNQLQLYGRAKNELLKSITRNLPAYFNFCEYSCVRRYDGTINLGRAFNLDIYAKAKNPGDYHIIGEIKNRDERKFSVEEVMAFAKKFSELQEIEVLTPVVGFIFSRVGFTAEAEILCLEKGFAFSQDEQWLDL